MECVKNWFSAIVSLESFNGILLLVCALLAMIVANSPLSSWYFALWQIQFGFSFMGTTFEMNLEHWINDVLMAFFFLVVGLEIKRELLFGELAGIKRAAFPIIAALGGMVIPGVIYFCFNANTPSQHGFGIPMATDIAFSLAVLLALGSRVSAVVKVFLVSLAVADDLGAILVIALFYTEQLHLWWLLVAFGIVCLLMCLNKFGVKSLIPYMTLGVFLWVAVHNCGIHATIAAVVLAFCIPAHSQINMVSFYANIRHIFASFNEKKQQSNDILDLDAEELQILEAINREKSKTTNPSMHLEHALAPYSNYFIMPLFAFANAGVAISAQVDFGIDYVFLGIFFGLVLGKPMGIFLFTFLAEKLGVAQRPAGVSWFEIFAAGALAGIGFTMSMFVTNLAFLHNGEHGQMATDVAKISILIASLVAGIVGSILFVVRSKVLR